MFNGWVGFAGSPWLIDDHHIKNFVLKLSALSWMRLLCTHHHPLPCLQITRNTRDQNSLQDTTQFRSGCIKLEWIITFSPPRGTFSKTLYFHYCLYFRGLCKIPRNWLIVNRKAILAKKTCWRVSSFTTKELSTVTFTKTAVHFWREIIRLSLHEDLSLFWGESMSGGTRKASSTWMRFSFEGIQSFFRIFFFPHRYHPFHCVAKSKAPDKYLSTHKKNPAPRIFFAYHPFHCVAKSKLLDKYLYTYKKPHTPPYPTSKKTDLCLLVLVYPRSAKVLFLHVSCCRSVLCRSVHLQTMPS